MNAICAARLTEVGALFAEDDSGQTLAIAPVVTRPIDHGDWQRELIAFRLAQPATVRVRFHYQQALPVWTGAISISGTY